jgi:glycosyltransferase involved in cell wall biosynthesis
MTSVLVVANEQVHPPLNGGRVRMAALVDALRSRFDVQLHEPPPPRRSLAATIRPAPRRGTSVLRPGDVTVDGADVVLYTHSYLEPVGPRTDRPVVVDFQNLEVDRQRSMAREGDLPHRASAAIEAVKARRWEPRTAAAAALCLAVTDDDAAVLRRWGARRVVVVPNAATAERCPPSPADGPVTFLADHRYGPNRVASAWLVDAVWPLVARRRPDARLRVCGRGTDDEVDDVTATLAAASMLTAPVQSGGGTQLKVVEALAHGRVVVATTYSARSAPTTARDACISTVDADDMADAIVRLLDDVAERHRLERAARVLTWRDATAPLLDAIEALA